MSQFVSPSISSNAGTSDHLLSLEYYVLVEKLMEIWDRQAMIHRMNINRYRIKTRTGHKKHDGLALLTACCHHESWSYRIVSSSLRV